MPIRRRKQRLDVYVYGSSFKEWVSRRRAELAQRRCSIRRPLACARGKKAETRRNRGISGDRRGNVQHRCQVNDR
jgi:hypothetical protein